VQVALTGSNRLIGSALTSALERHGRHGVRPVRHALGNLHQRSPQAALQQSALRIAVGQFADQGAVARQSTLPYTLNAPACRFQQATVEQALR
jgi:NAD dependent epimerase/dehydratase family enzyme